MARKYAAELMVGVMTYGYVLVRPQELGEVEGPRTDETHIYLIGTRPRVTIDPASVMMRADGLTATCQWWDRDTAHSFRIVGKHNLGSRVFLESAYPYTDFAIRSVGDREPLVAGPVINLYAKDFRGFPPECRDLQVLYVGKAYGEDGSRSSLDRLPSLATLQRILTDVTPDRQVWLILARIDDLTINGGFNASGEGSVDEDEDTKHYARALRWLNSDFATRKESVDLAEAGLIRYFKPRYNTQLRESFPSKGHSVIQSLKDLDLNSFVVELQLQDLHIYAGNEAVKPANFHAQLFEINFEADRGPMLDILQPRSTNQTGIQL
jgi:hypothetical protein